MKPKTKTKNVDAPIAFGSADIYKSLFDNMLDGVAYYQMIYDEKDRPIDFIILEVNKNFETLTGLHNAAGKKVTELIPDFRETNGDVIETYGRVAKTQKPERFTTFVKQLSRWFSVSVYSPKKDFFVTIFQNITAQMELEQSVEKEKIATRNVLEDLNIEKNLAEKARVKEEAILLSIGDGLIATDEKGYISIVNKVAENLLGKKSKNILGKGFFEVIDVEDDKGNPIPLQKRPMYMALMEGTVTNITNDSPSYFYVRGKTKFPVAMIVTPVMLNGEVIGTIEVFRDITREKEIDKAKNEFVSLVSHQLRTPLTTISWYTEMILNGDVGEVLDRQKKYLEEIYRGNKLMIDLVDALLDVSRIELGTFIPEPIPIDIIALAESVINEQKQKITSKKLQINRHFDKDFLIFLVDPKLMRMILQNLLANAVEYTPPGGKIDVTVSSDDHKNLSIQIADTGYGIPREQQGKIFTKFFRADNVRSKNIAGTGLGLYIVKSSVERSGGIIRFESEENEGTTFYLTFPLEEAKIEEPQKKEINEK